MSRSIKEIRAEMEEAVVKYAMGEEAHLNRLAKELLAAMESGESVPLEIGFDQPTTAEVRPVDPRRRFESVA